jgi:hypothetical protein
MDCRRYRRGVIRRDYYSIVFSSQAPRPASGPAARHTTRAGVGSRDGIGVLSADTSSGRICSPRFERNIRRYRGFTAWPRFAIISLTVRRRALHAIGSHSVNAEQPGISDSATKRTRTTFVSISRWVNQPLPPWNQILTAHDVARLTRRPCWVLCGLSWIWRFPKKLRYEGRRIGWLRSDVLNWMTKDLSLAAARQPAPALSTARSRTLSTQNCLPLKCSSDGKAIPQCSARRNIRERRPRPSHPTNLEARP